MDERSKNKLKNLINLKYIFLLADTLALQERGLEKKDYDSFAWDLAVADRSLWDEWRIRHGVLNDTEWKFQHGALNDTHEGYVKLDGGVADRAGIAVRDGLLTNAGFVLVPEDLAQKALVLGELPK